MSSNGRASTREQILDAARAMFEEHGYHGAGVGAVGERAGVSRQAVYLHFPSKAELLTALHRHIFTTDVVPALARHPVDDAMTAWEALDATIAADVEIAAKVWQIHEVLTVARRQHPEVDETLRPREEEHYGLLVRLGRRLDRDGALPPGVDVETFADMVWGLLNTGTYRSLVVERGWSLDRYGAWVRRTIRLLLGAGDRDRPADDRRPTDDPRSSPRTAGPR